MPTLLGGGLDTKKVHGLEMVQPNIFFFNYLIDFLKEMQKSYLWFVKKSSHVPC